jgi:hypothetical protein
LKEANTGSGLRFGNALRGYITYVIPTILIIVFLASLMDKFLPALFEKEKAEVTPPAIEEVVQPETSSAQ